MNNVDLEKQIIDLIPSQTTRDAIYEQNYKFMDLEYVQLVIEFATTWKSKIDLLNKIKMNTNNQNLANYLEAYVKSEIESYKLFIKNDTYFVYDVIMDCRNASSERYLCPSYNSVSKVIESYIEKFKDFIEDDDLRHIKIVKRKISIWEKPEDIDEPGDIVVYLNADKEIEVIYNNDDYIEPENYNLNIGAIKYPTIYKAGDLVYIDKSKCKCPMDNDVDYYYAISKNKIFGIVGFNQNQLYNNGDIDVCYFLNLSNEYVHFRSIGYNEGQYINYLNCHMLDLSKFFGHFFIEFYS